MTACVFAGDVKRCGRIGAGDVALIGGVIAKRKKAALKHTPGRPRCVLAHEYDIVNFLQFVGAFYCTAVNRLIGPFTLTHPQNCI